MSGRSRAFPIFLALLLPSMLLRSGARAIVLFSPLLLLSACYGSAVRFFENRDVSSEGDLVGDNEEAVDADGEGQGDDFIDPAVDQDSDDYNLLDAPDSVDDHEGEAPPVLVPEGPEELYPTDTGRRVRPSGSPIAFSGNVYSLLLVDELNDTIDDPLGFFRLAPGGESLETSWVSSIPNSADVDLCWSGETFIAAFSRVGIGIQHVSIYEDGTLANPMQLLVDDPGNELSSSLLHYPIIACPMEGPMVFDTRQRDNGLERLYLFSNDGAYDDRYVDTSLPGTLAEDFNYPPCTIVGNEAACIGAIESSFDAGIVFIGRDGHVRYSEPLPAGITIISFAMLGCTIAEAGDNIAVIGIMVETELNKNRLLYALYDREGRLIVPPIASVPVGSNTNGIQAASSGSNILVQAPGMGDEFAAPPHLYLLDLEGHALDTSHPLTDASVYDSSEMIGVFWEGDAYAVLRTTYLGVMYRRFRVE
jgi:hypothetical protein